MSTDTQSQNCEPHGQDPKTCVQCHLEAEQTKGKALATDVGEVLKKHGLDTPADQFGALLGLGVTGLVRVVGMPLDQMLEAVQAAYATAHGGKPAA